MSTPRSLLKSVLRRTVFALLNESSLGSLEGPCVSLLIDSPTSMDKASLLTLTMTEKPVVPVGVKQLNGAPQLTEKWQHARVN